MYPLSRMEWRTPRTGYTWAGYGMGGMPLQFPAGLSCYRCNGLFTYTDWYRSLSWGRRLVLCRSSHTRIPVPNVYMPWIQLHFYPYRYHIHVCEQAILVITWNYCTLKKDDGRQYGVHTHGYPSLMFTCPGYSSISIRIGTISMYVNKPY